MPSTSFLIFVGIIMVFLVLGVIFLLPSEKRPAEARKKRPQDEEENNKDWKEVSLRLEKHIQSFARRSARFSETKGSWNATSLLRKKNTPGFRKSYPRSAAGRKKNLRMSNENPNS
jgi:hypothetical protein